VFQESLSCCSACSQWWTCLVVTTNGWTASDPASASLLSSLLDDPPRKLLPAPLTLAAERKPRFPQHLLLCSTCSSVESTAVVSGSLCERRSGLLLRYQDNRQQQRRQQQQRRLGTRDSSTPTSRALSALAVTLNKKATCANTGRRRLSALDGVGLHVSSCSCRHRPPLSFWPITQSASQKATHLPETSKQKRVGRPAVTERQQQVLRQLILEASSALRSSSSVGLASRGFPSSKALGVRGGGEVMKKNEPRQRFGLILPLKPKTAEASSQQRKWRAIQVGIGRSWLARRQAHQNHDPLCCKTPPVTTKTRTATASLPRHLCSRTLRIHAPPRPRGTPPPLRQGILRQRRQVAAAMDIRRSLSQLPLCRSPSCSEQRPRVKSTSSLLRLLRRNLSAVGLPQLQPTVARSSAWGFQS